MKELSQILQDGCEQRRDSVDTWLIRANLALSYEERVAQHQNTLDCIAELQRIGSENRAKTSKSPEISRHKFS